MVTKKLGTVFCSLNKTIEYIDESSLTNRKQTKKHLQKLQTEVGTIKDISQLCEVHLVSLVVGPSIGDVSKQVVELRKTQIRMQNRISEMENDNRKSSKEIKTLHQKIVNLQHGVNQILAHLSNSNSSGNQSSRQVRNSPQLSNQVQMRPNVFNNKEVWYNNQGAIILSFKIK